MKNTTKTYSFEFTSREVIALQRATLEIWSQLEDGIKKTCCYDKDKKLYQDLSNLFSLDYLERDTEE